MSLKSLLHKAVLVLASCFQARAALEDHINQLQEQLDQERAANQGRISAEDSAALTAAKDAAEAAQKADEDRIAALQTQLDENDSAAAELADELNKHPDAPNVSVVDGGFAVDSPAPADAETAPATDSEEALPA